MVSLHSIVVTLAIPTLAAGIAAEFLYLLTANQKVWSWASRLLLFGACLVALSAFAGTQVFDTVSLETREFAGGHRNSGFMLLWSLIGVIATRFLFVEFQLFKSFYRWVYYALLIMLAVLLFRTTVLGNRVGEINESPHTPKEQRLDKRGLFNSNRPLASSAGRGELLQGVIKAGETSFPTRLPILRCLWILLQRSLAQPVRQSFTGDTVEARYQTHIAFLPIGP